MQILALGRHRPPRQLAAGTRTSSPAFVARWWTHGLIEPLSAATLALVEGPADRILVGAVAELLGVDLHKQDILVTELEGAGNFELMYDLFGPSGFGLKVVGLVDEDHESQWASAIGVDKARLAANGVQVSRPDLEGEYVTALGPSRVANLLVTSGHFTESNVKGAAATLGAVTTSDMLIFCGRKRNKTMAAAAIAAGMSSTEAGSLSSVVELLKDCHA
jgi:putative ATP-dependent endonuclease of the OLD family